MPPPRLTSKLPPPRNESTKPSCLESIVLVEPTAAARTQHHSHRTAASGGVVKPPLASVPHRLWLSEWLREASTPALLQAVAATATATPNVTSGQQDPTAAPSPTAAASHKPLALFSLSVAPWAVTRARLLSALGGEACAAGMLAVAPFAFAEPRVVSLEPDRTVLRFRFRPPPLAPLAPPPPPPPPLASHAASAQLVSEQAIPTEADGTIAALPQAIPIAATAATADASSTAAASNVTADASPSASGSAPHTAAHRLHHAGRRRRRRVMLVSHFYNEALLLPLFIRHHAPLFDHAVLIDYNSTDGSADIVREQAPASWTVVNSSESSFSAKGCDIQVRRCPTLPPQRHPPYRSSPNPPPRRASYFCVLRFSARVCVLPGTCR